MPMSPALSTVCVSAVVQCCHAAHKTVADVSGMLSGIMPGMSCMTSFASGVL